MIFTIPVILQENNPINEFHYSKLTYVEKNVPTVTCTIYQVLHFKKYSLLFQRNRQALRVESKNKYVF